MIQRIILDITHQGWTYYYKRNTQKSQHGHTHQSKIVYKENDKETDLTRVYVPNISYTILPPIHNKGLLTSCMV